MSFTLTFEERETLYEQALDRRSGISDALLALRREDYEETDRLARSFADDMILIVDGCRRLLAQLDGV